MKFSFYSLFQRVCYLLAVVALCLGAGLLISLPLFFFSKRFPRAFLFFAAFVFLCFFASILFQFLKKKFTFRGLSREEISKEKRLYLIRSLKILYIILSISGGIFLVLRGSRLPALAVLVMPFVIFRISAFLRRKKPLKLTDSSPK